MSEPQILAGTHDAGESRSARLRHSGAFCFYDTPAQAPADRVASTGLMQQVLARHPHPAQMLHGAAHPWRLAELHGSLRTTLRHAIELGGSSMSDYVDAGGVRDFFQLEHRVYSRTGQPCKVCGAPVQRIVLSGRSTHFCKNCQK